MTDETPAEVATAFEDHDAFERHETAGTDVAFRLTTTVFETRITADPAEGPLADYHVTVFVPTLRGAVADDSVGDAVQDGWLETLERRLEDAPKATRAAVDLDGFDVSTDGETVTVRYDFSFGNADRAVEIAKTFVEYVEGTYVEGVVPGYDYESPVTDLLGAATTGSDGERGGTPL